MGDSRRFHLFSELVTRNLKPSEFHRLADVAGGKGVLAKKLRKSGFKEVVTFDKRKLRGKGKKSDLGFRNTWFTYEERDSFDAVVAMHPDQGTDHAILYAARRRVPAIVCPCCVLPHAASYKGPKHFDKWIMHLKDLAEGHSLTTQEAQLPMRGRNLVLIMRPR